MYLQHQIPSILALHDAVQGNFTGIGGRQSDLLAIASINNEIPGIREM